jgi:sulfur transporter
MMIVPRELGLVIAVVIGIGFGFVLERAGFGRANKLAAQFYLRDMTVFKVMFSAIVTAMLGLVIAGSAGLVNLREISESIASFTYIWPMLFGGLLLGVGFIVSGYCPGTSIVASASGNIDGMFAFGGVVTGTFLYSELLQIPAVHHFHTSGDKGSWFLYDLIHVPPQLIAVAITAMAILAFIGAEKVEKWIAGAVPQPKRLAFATLATTAAIALIAIALPVRAPAATQPVKSITAAELSRRIVDAPWTVRIIDTRQNAKDHIPGSEIVDPNTVADVPDDGRTLVVVGDAKRLPKHARVLAGGISSWTNDPLARAMATGAPPPPPPTPAAGGSFAKPKKKGGGCSA